MSVFKVSLNKFNTGPVDKNAFPASGSVTGRTMYVDGPHLIKRLLRDGETFTDCNYWKQFAYPQLKLGDAFIEVVSDDGSEYSSVGCSSSSYPKVYTLTPAINATYTTAGSFASVLADTGASAVMAQITNNGTGPVKIRLNGSASAVLDLPAGRTQIFENGDLSINLIEVDNSGSGAAIGNVQILVSVKSACRS